MRGHRHVTPYIAKGPNDRGTTGPGSIMPEETGKKTTMSRSIQFTFYVFIFRTPAGSFRKHEAHKLTGHKERTTARARGVVPPLCPAGLFVLCTPHDVPTHLSVLPEQPCFESEKGRD